MSLDRSRQFRGRALRWQGVLPLLAGLVAVACAPGFERVQSESRAKLYKLERGMPRAEVLEAMGTEPMEYNKGMFTTGAIPQPWDAEEHVLGGESVEILYYVTNIRTPDGEISDDELTPLVLVEGKLAGWGWPFLADFERRIGLERVGPRPPGSADATG
jgi:hypothetical protein